MSTRYERVSLGADVELHFPVEGSARSSDLEERVLEFVQSSSKESISKTIAQMIEALPTEQAALLKTADDDAIAIVLSSHGIHVKGIKLLREWGSGLTC